MLQGLWREPFGVWMVRRRGLKRIRASGPTHFADPRGRAYEATYRMDGDRMADRPGESIDDPSSRMGRRGRAERCRSAVGAGKPAGSPYAKANWRGRSA